MNRPNDTVEGDWLQFNEFGLMLFLGKLAAAIKASDVCKLEVFYTDNLLREWAYNFEQFTAGSEIRAMADGEYWTRISLFSPYTWERLGLKNSAQTAFEDMGERYTGDSAAGRESVQELQEGLFRYVELEGHLGNIYRRTISVPTSETPDINVSGENADNKMRGVYDEWIGPEGTRLVRTAKGLILAKTPFIPSLTRKKSVDDPEGDTNVEIEEIEEFDTSISTNPEINALRIIDWMSYLSNFYSRRNLDSFNKDWGYPDESALNYGTEETVDSTLGTAKYKDPVAFFAITDDGAIMMQSAQGSAIYIGEDIRIAPARHLIQTPGESLISIVSKDTILKSYEDIDISSATGEVRVKAEKNLSMLGGNQGGSYGVMIESRGTSEQGQYPSEDAYKHGGLTLKSKSAVTLYGRYIRASGGDVSLTAEYTLWTGAGFNHISTAGSVMYDIVGEKDANADNVGARMLTRSANIITVQTLIGGTTIIAGRDSKAHLYLEGSLSSGGSGVFAKGASMLPVKGAGDVAEQKVAIKEYNETAASTADSTRAAEDEAAWASSDYYEKTGVSFRSSVSLGISGLEFCEAPWQRNLTGASKWSEPAVTQFADGGRITKPFPGKDLEQTSILKTVTIFNATIEGKPTTPPYENKSEEDVVSSKPFTEYTLG
jgi:hypothetical protein